MELSVRLYLGLIVAVALGRVLELRHSRRNQQQLRQNGSRQAAEPGYKWMVAFHSSVLVGSCVEVVVLQRPWIPALGISALALFTLANLTRWWVIRTLGTRWNTEVMSASRLGIITAGPYRWVRHPNYTAVFAEMLALPLIHSAWITATLGTLAHVIVLRRRVLLEESVMAQNPHWKAAFAAKPRFIP
jgi:methyltransferase